ASVARVVARTERMLGPIDLLVNNAGTCEASGPLWQTDPAIWWRDVEIDLLGPVLLCHAVLPGMVERRRGRVINISSGAATYARAYLSSYTCAKTALTRLTEVLAAEAAPHGVQVFAYSPR